MSINKKSIFGTKKPFTEANTFIAGAGTFLTSPAVLSTVLIGVSENDIVNFQIDANNNVSFYIAVNYQIEGNDGVNNSVFVGSGIKDWIDVDGYCTGVNDRSFKGIGSLQFLYLPNATYIQQRAFESSITAGALFPNVTILNGGGTYDKQFRPMFASNKLLTLPRCTTFGDNVEHNTIFCNSSSADARATIIYAEASMETINAGGIEPDLLAHNNGVGSVKFNANYSAPSEVSSLALQTAYADSLDIQWTAPSSTNAIDWYIVFINKRFAGITAATSYTITGLSSGTEYTVEVMAVDEMGNNSGFSNQLITSTL